MKMDKKLEYYLRNSVIEFTDNYLLEVIPQDKKEAVILTAPKSFADYRYFSLQYNGNKFYYGTIEQMMDYCVAHGYLNRKASDKLAKECHALRGDE